QDGERIDSIFGGDIAHRGQGIAFFEHAVENHMDDTIPKLSINRLIIIPFTIHPVLQTPTATNLRATPPIASFASYGDIVNYNTRSRASLFLKKILRRSSLRCSHGAVSPCTTGSDTMSASTRRGGYNWGANNGRWPVRRLCLILSAPGAVNNRSDTRCDPGSLPRAVRIVELESLSPVSLSDAR